MKPLTTMAACILAMLLAAPLLADETEQQSEARQQAETQAEQAPLTQRLRENPDDTGLLNQYMVQMLREIGVLLNKDPDAAEKKLNEMAEYLDSLQPQQPAAKQLLSRAQSVAGVYRQRLELARVSLEDLREKLEADPNDGKSLSAYISKVTQQIAPLARSAPDDAEKQLEEARKFLASVSEKTEQEATKRLIDNSQRTFASLERTIQSGKKLAALIGRDAAPLKVEAWANGEPLTESDLKGKVVLLDFWAVWCGPCIATFPHLREWQEKYADQGLVIIGLTRFYNYTWDDEAERAKRSQQEVPKEQELEMLERFAESHDLHHRFAIQQGREMSDYYGVTGIPHVVVIDQEQKVRLMRVGSGEANAQAVEAMIKELLGEGAGS